jgi:hypothetical protein
MVSRFNPVLWLEAAVEYCREAKREEPSRMLRWGRCLPRARAQSLTAAVEKSSVIVGRLYPREMKGSRQFHRHWFRSTHVEGELSQSSLH